MGTTNAKRRRLSRGFAAIAATLLASSASAQTSDLSAARLPGWDASGSVGLHNVRASEAGGAQDFDYWEPQWDLRAQVGRYLTPHLKLEVGALAPRQYEFYEQDQIPATGLPGGFGFAPIERNVTAVTFAPAVTWQFFENAFVHPYVSAGVAVNVMDVHRFRASGTTAIQLTGTRTVRYDVPGIDTRDTIVNARPFVSIGTKSYFNEHWFARPEVHIAAAPAGVGQVSLRLGIGRDF